MKLDQIITGISAGPRRTMIYGPHGVGKSTFGAQAPGEIFLPTEDGIGNIDCASFPLIESLDDFKAALRSLYREEHSYQTIVIDSLDWLERMIWATACLDAGEKNIADIPYGRGYANALPIWEGILKSLTKLRLDKKLGVVLIAHSKIERFEDPEQESYDRYSPKLHKLASGICQEWSDEVLFATYKVFTKQNEEGFNRKRTVGVGTGERVLRTNTRPAHIAKNRLGLPDEIPMTWTAYADHFPKG